MGFEFGELGGGIYVDVSYFLRDLDFYVAVVAFFSSSFVVVFGVGVVVR